jgi:hypothetical protein
VEPYRAAREMYFHYLGSSFYMSRDGAIGEIQARFDSCQVPEDVIRQWSVELKAQQLASLNQPGNWCVLGFLEHHSYLEHLAEVIAQPPLGRLWEKCAYLEQLLTYIDRCVGQTNDGRAPHYPPRQLWSALDHVIPEAERLIRGARASSSIDRANQIAENTRKRLAACEDATGHRVFLWRWHSPTATATPYPVSD